MLHQSPNVLALFGECGQVFVLLVLRKFQVRYKLDKVIHTVCTITYLGVDVREEERYNMLCSMAHADVRILC